MAPHSQLKSLLLFFPLLATAASIPGPPDLSCINGHRGNFSIACNTQYVGSTRVGTAYVSNFDSCLAACTNNLHCVLAEYSPRTTYCVISSEPGLAQASIGVWAASKAPEAVEADAAAASADTTSAGSSASAVNAHDLASSYTSSVLDYLSTHSGVSATPAAGSGSSADEQYSSEDPLSAYAASLLNYLSTASSPSATPAASSVDDQTSSQDAQELVSSYTASVLDYLSTASVLDYLSTASSPSATSAAGSTSSADEQDSSENPLSAYAASLLNYLSTASSPSATPTANSVDDQTSSQDAQELISSYIASVLDYLSTASSPSATSAAGSASSADEQDSSENPLSSYAASLLDYLSTASGLSATPTPSSASSEDAQDLISSYTASVLDYLSAFTSVYTVPTASSASLADGQDSSENVRELILSYTASVLNYLSTVSNPSTTPIATPATKHNYGAPHVEEGMRTYLTSLADSLSTPSSVPLVRSPAPEHPPLPSSVISDDFPTRSAFSDIPSPSHSSDIATDVSFRHLGEPIDATIYHTSESTLGSEAYTTSTVYILWVSTPSSSVAPATATAPIPSGYLPEGPSPWLHRSSRTWTSAPPSTTVVLPPLSPYMPESYFSSFVSHASSLTKKPSHIFSEHLPATVLSERLSSTSTFSLSASTHTSSSTPLLSASSTKRGLPLRLPEQLAPFTSGTKLNWVYNWCSTPPTNLSSTLLYTPMLWSPAQDHTAQWDDNVYALGNGTRLPTHLPPLLSFNEPDCPSQANLNETVAAAAWRVYFDKFRDAATLVSPAVTNGPAPGGLQWLQTFLGVCTGCTIHAIAIHWYGDADNVDGFMDYIQRAVVIGAGRKVWITEFHAQGSQSQVRAFLGTVLPWLDALDGVEKYAYFWEDGEWKDGKGGLGEAANVYASL